MPRYELPPDLTPEEERAVIAALEETFRTQKARLSPWALAGRTQNVGYGRLQIRHDVAEPWSFKGRVPFAREGTPNLQGRGDAR